MTILIFMVLKMKCYKTIALIGGGFIGLSLAWWLRRAGWSVTVYESARDVTRSAGYAAAGMLAAQLEQEPGEEHLAPLLSESQRLWPAFRDALESDSGLSLDYQDAGTLMVATDANGLARLRHDQAYLRRLGWDPQWLMAAEARAREPWLSPQTLGALFCPADHHVDPRRVLGALGHVLGDVILYNRQVVHLTPTPKGVEITENTGQKTKFDRVILCQGAWAGQEALIPDLPPLDPVKGQALYLTMPGPSLSHVVWGEDVYLVPRCDHRLYIGATVEPVGFDTRITAGGLYHLLKQARLVVPTMLEGAITETLIGYRPRTLNDTPVVQPSSVPGVFMALGHYRNGVLLAPWTCLAGERMVGGV
jgi:glycine oxidase